MYNVYSIVPIDVVIIMQLINEKHENGSEREYPGNIKHLNAKCPIDPYAQYAVISSM